MQLFNVGPLEVQYAFGASSISFTPLPDRAAKIRRIGISAPSASDTWIVTCAGKEIMRLRVNTVGNNNIVRADDQAAMPHTDFFSFVRKYLQQDPSLPVPQGQILTVASVGGATADLILEFTEWSPSDLSPSMLNHPDGKEFLIPLYSSLAASVAAAGVINDDTQISPAWLPTFLIGTPGTTAWKLSLLALFMDGAGVNTFSGAANHQSTTRTKRFVKNSVSLGARTTAGFPNLGAASAAGSANTVYGQVASQFSPWERSIPSFDQVFDSQIDIQNGDEFNAQTEVTGDVTGGASYANVLTVYAARISRLQ